MNYNIKAKNCKAFLKKTFNNLLKCLLHSYYNYSFSCTFSGSFLNMCASKSGELCLARAKLVISAIKLQQILVIAALGNFAVFKHHNCI